MKMKFLTKATAMMLAVCFLLSFDTIAFATDDSTSSDVTQSAESTEVSSQTEETTSATEPTTESTQPTTASTEPTTPAVSYNGSAGKNLKYSFNSSTGTLKITGNGTTMNNYSLERPAPWYYFASKIKSVNLKNANNLKKIGNYSFANLNKMTKFSYPDSVRKIGERAFMNTSKLSTFTVKKKVKSLGTNAFENSGIVQIKFLSTTTEINGNKNAIPATATIKAYAKSSTAYKYAKKYLRNYFLMISEITFAETHDVITKGTKYTIDTTVTPKNPTVSKLKWKSSNKKVATVNSKGVVKAKKVGTSIITAKATDGSGAKSIKFKIIVTNFKLNKYIFTSNNCYKLCSAIDPKGIVVHSTGAVTPNLSSYIPNWNVAKPGGREVCVHGFVGTDSNGKIATYQTLPFEMACWGCGSGSKGSYNYYPGYIQFECCEDSLNSRSYLNKIYDEATDFCAYLCLKYCLSYNTIVSHAGANAKGYASAHGDIDHWLKRFGLTMNDFRNTVKKKIYAIDSNPDLTTGSKHKSVTVKNATTLWSKPYADEYGTGSKSKATIEKGSTVKYYRDSFSGWSMVKYKGKIGYVRNSDIKLNYTSKYNTLKIEKHGVKYYSRPSGKNKFKVGTFSYGTKVKRICKIKSGSKKGWSLVKYKNKEYYCKY